MHLSRYFVSRLYTTSTVFSQEEAYPPAESQENCLSSTSGPRRAETLRTLSVSEGTSQGSREGDAKAEKHKQ